MARQLPNIALAAFLTGDRQADRVVPPTGNAAGLTADSLDDLTERVSASSQQTVGDVRQIAIALASGQRR